MEKLPCNIDRMKRVIAALRSDTYRQIFGQLRWDEAENCRCATGVICDVAAEDDVGKWGKGPYSSDSKYPLAFMALEHDYGDPFIAAYYAVPPSSVAIWLGIERDALWEVADWNDRLHMTLTQIADKLEETYLMETPANV